VNVKETNNLSANIKREIGRYLGSTSNTLPPVFRSVEETFHNNDNGLPALVAASQNFVKIVSYVISYEKFIRTLEPETRLHFSRTYQMTSKLREYFEL
jgi:hypothetical protein